MQTYRITQTRYAHSLVASGVEARWNSKGMLVIYTAGSIALACLENLVHRTGASLQAGDFSIATVNIPDTIIQIDEITIDELSKADKGWASATNYPLTQKMGDEWLNSLKSAVLKVPSAIIPNEFNYLLNATHPNFKKIELISVNKFAFDPRLKTD